MALRLARCPLRLKVSKGGYIVSTLNGNEFNSLEGLTHSEINNYVKRYVRAYTQHRTVLGKVC